MIRSVLYLIICAFVLIGCSGVKRSETNLSKGNYDDSIRISIKKIRNGRNSKAIKQHIQILEEAFELATNRDESRIRTLEQQNFPENTQEIYETYIRLENRQAQVENLLPLKGASFNIKDYSEQIAAAKTNYSNHLFNQGTSFLSKGGILDARQAHNRFSRLKQLQPEREKLDSLLSQAHFLGTDFVHVKIENRTEQVIPRRLEEAILDFDTYELDDFWTEYHGVPQENVDYNFGIILEIRQILVSPDRVYEKEFDREKRIRDGWEYVLDDNGNVKKDSLGNDIKVDVFRNLRARVLVTSQDKSVRVEGNIIYRNLQETRNMRTYPIASEFAFEHVFAEFQGDEGALTDDDIKLARRSYVDFPSNEQMIFDTSTDLKRRFAAILRRKKLR